MQTFTLESFAKFLGDEIATSRLPHAEAVALEVGAKMIADEAKRVIGTYDYNWPQLAPSTQTDRVAHGYPPDEPLLRTGEMRDSIEYTVHAEAREADIGSNSDIAVWQELGTARIPPRPFLAGAASAMGEHVAEAMGEIIFAEMEAGSIENEVLRKALEAVEEVRKTGREIADDSDDSSDRP